MILKTNDIEKLQKLKEKEEKKLLKLKKKVINKIIFKFLREKKFNFSMFVYEFSLPKNFLFSILTELQKDKELSFTTEIAGIHEIIHIELPFVNSETIANKP